jgi:hypothetical protein
MKAQVNARWPWPFAQSKTPMASKALAAGLAKERWNERTQDAILTAWNFNEADGNGEADDRGNNDDEMRLLMLNMDTMILRKLI